MPAVGIAHLLAHFHAQAVAEHIREQAQATRELDVVAIGRGPVNRHDGFRDLRVHLEIARERLVGELHYALGRKRGTLAALGQRTEGARHGGHRGVEVEVAHDGDFDGTLGQLRREPRLRLFLRAAEQHFARRQAKTSVAARQQSRHFEHERSLRHVRELVVVRLDRLADLAKRLGPVARIRDVRGEQLQLEQQVLSIGAAAQRERVVVDGEIRAQRFPGEQPLKVIGAVPAQPASDKGARGKHRQPRLVLRFRELAIADAHRHVHLVGLEIGLLQIEPDAVGKRDERGVEIFHATRFRHGARRAELGVGKRRLGDLRRRRNRLRLCALVGLRDHGRGIALDLRIADDEDMTLRHAPSGTQRLGAGLGRHLGELRSIELQLRLRRGENVVVCHAVGNCLRELGRATGAGRLHGLLQPLTHVGDSLGELGLLETVFQRAPQLVLSDAQRRLPLLRFAHQLDRGLAVEIEYLLHAGLPTEERHALLFRQNRDTAVEHRQRQSARQVFQTIHARIGLLGVRRERHDRDRRRRCLALEMGKRAHALKFGEAAWVWLRQSRRTIFHRGHRLGELFFHLRRIEIAHGHHRDALGAVPGVVEMHEIIALDLLDHLLRADRHALAQQRVGQGKPEHRHHHPVLDGVACAHLRQDDRTLLLHRLLLQKQPTGVVGKYPKAFGERLALRVRQVDHVHGAFKRRVRVGIAAEVHA